MRATQPQVQNALSRKGKEAAVEKLTAAFEESTAVFGIRFQKISVSVHLNSPLSISRKPFFIAGIGAHESVGMH